MKDLSYDVVMAKYNNIFYAVELLREVLRSDGHNKSLSCSDNQRRFHNSPKKERNLEIQVTHQEIVFLRLF